MIGIGDFVRIDGWLARVINVADGMLRVRRRDRSLAWVDAAEAVQVEPAEHLRLVLGDAGVAALSHKEA